MKKLTGNTHRRSNISTDIPAGYNTTKMCILPCSPVLFYLYWELPADILTSNTTLALRILSIDEEQDEGSTLALIPLERTATSSYYQASAPDAPLLYELVATTDSVSSVLCSATRKPLRRQTPLVPEPAQPSVAQPDLPGLNPVLIHHTPTAVVERFVTQPTAATPGNTAVKVHMTTDIPSSWIHSKPL